MYDLKGVIAVIVAYPVHIMSFVGSILLFGLVLPRRRRQRKQLLISTEPLTEKKGFTQSEKAFLTGKIRDNSTASLKKSFAGKANPVYITLTAIGLIVVFFLWIAWMLSDPPMSPVISKILELLLGGIITLAFLGMLAAGIIGCFFLLRSLLKRGPKMHHFRRGHPTQHLKKQGINNQT
jgi:membrane associated rhomboid family serine protease